MSDGDRARVAALLDELTKMVEHARGVPMSASVMVGRAEVLDLITQIRDSLPGQIVVADRLLGEAEDVRDRAQERGEQLIADARARAERLVEAHEITRAARRRADEIIAEAEEKAAALLSEADDHCDRQLAAFEVDLGRVMQQTKAARDYLAQRIDRARQRSAESPASPQGDDDEEPEAR